MESASIGSMQEVFGPELTIKYCHFHVMKAARDYFLSKCRLRLLLQDEEWGGSIRRWVCSFANLAYLKPEHIGLGLNALGTWIGEFLRQHPQPATIRRRLKGGHFRG
jgi:hypothetical protein